MAPNFQVPAGMWKPESSCCWSVTLFKLAQYNWNNILQLLEVFYYISVSDQMQFTGIQVPILAGFYVRKLESPLIIFY